MPDKVTIENGKVMLVTDEGREFVFPEDELLEMLRREIEAPVNGVALPDGIKFIEWRAPFLCLVHQLPPHVRKVFWITDDSPVPYGPAAKFEKREISIPYAITFAMFWQRGKQLSLTDYNELYFRNEPLQLRSDNLGFPALLNVSKIDTKNRSRAWICTQHVHRDLSKNWSVQLGYLLDHCWNGAFSLSSEFHEGASWYGESKGVHPDLHPIEKWQAATRKDKDFALTVKWKPCPMNVGELMNAMLEECHSSLRHRTTKAKAAANKSASLVARFVNHVQTMTAKP